MVGLPWIMPSVVGTEATTTCDHIRLGPSGPNKAHSCRIRLGKVKADTSLQNRGKAPKTGRSMSEILRNYIYARSLLGSVLIILAHVYSEPSAWSIVGSLTSVSLSTMMLVHFPFTKD